MEFEKMINGVEISRIIGSWLRSGGILTGSYRKDQKFIMWLKSLVLNGCSFADDEIQEIYHYVKMITDGKLELEVSAETFLKEGA